MGNSGVSQGTVSSQGVRQCASPLRNPATGAGMIGLACLAYLTIGLGIRPDWHAERGVGREVAVGAEHARAYLRLQAPQRMPRQRRAAKWL